MKLSYWSILLNVLPSMITAESLRGNALDWEDDREGMPVNRLLSSAVESIERDIVSEEEPVLFEGDIVPTIDYIMQSYGEDFEKKLEEEGVLNHDLGDGKGSITLKKNAEPLHGTQRFNLWPDRVDGVVLVPWAFKSGQFTDTDRTNIKNWIDEMARQSGVIRFVPYTNQSEHIEVQNSSSGCWSYVGQIGGKQSLNLSSGCVYKGVTQHEFLHALGFSHEQSRTDRDTYVTINTSNIPTNRLNNFEKRTSSDSLGSPYDFGSVMHYGAYAFAIDRSIKTIITKNGEAIGQRAGASDTDVEQIRLMYQCSTGPRTLTEYNQNKCTSACPCWPEAEGCSSDDECQGSATCVSNTCKLGPTQAPTNNPTRQPVIEPTATPTTARPTEVGTTCYNLEFATTDTSDSSGEQAPNGSFSIDGFGTLPKSCHDTLTSSCEIRFCTNTGVMKLRAGNTDGWKFTITGDIGELLDKTTVPGGTHYPPFPTWMDTDQFDSYQMYKLDKGLPQPSSAPSSSAPSRITEEPSSAPIRITEEPSSAPIRITEEPSSAPIIPSEKPSFSPSTKETCYDLRFATTDTSNSSGEQAPNGSFSIDGFGTLPKSCHDTLTSSCEITLCTNTGEMKLRAGNTDGWKFTITGDIGELLEKTTVPGGRHYPPFPTWMDTDQFDSYQKYKLVKIPPQPSSSPSESPSSVPSESFSDIPSSVPSESLSSSPSNAPSQGDGSFQIKSASSSLCLAPKRVAAGQRVILTSCGRSGSIKWTIDSKGRIHNVSNSNLCLKRVGTTLQVAKCLNNHNFKFDHSSINKKLYLIKNGLKVVGFNGVAAVNTAIIFKSRSNNVANESWDII